MAIPESAESLTPSQGRVFEAGDQALFVDKKDRRYLVELAAGGEFHTHAGIVAHNDVIGRPDGLLAKASGGSNATFLVVLPTLAEYVLKMKRGAQVIYPKDLGPIMLMADIKAGDRVLEAGIGSGALSTTMLRAGAAIVGYELREDFAARARANVRGLLGGAALDRYDVHIRDIYDGIEHTGFDRVVLDLPEPWQVVPHLAGALRPGGLFLAYTPSVTQMAQVRHALADAPFAMVESVEFMRRTWHVEDQAVRPDHRMVAHTAFLTVGRYLGPRP